MKRTLTHALLMGLSLVPATLLPFRITYNVGPDVKGADYAKSNINVLIFKDRRDYEQLVKEQKLTDYAQKALTTLLDAQEYLACACAPEFSAGEVFLDELGDILIGWIFKWIKAIETDVATIHKWTQQKTGAVMEWTPAADQTDVQGWVYMVVVVAKNDQDAKGKVLFNGRIKPQAEFGLNISYSGQESKYTYRFDAMKLQDNAYLGAYLLNKTSLLRCHGIELGPTASKSNIEASVTDWSVPSSSPLAIVKYDTTNKEYNVPSCPNLKTFITKNFEDAWPGWQKVLGQAVSIQSKAPGNPQYNNYKNMNTNAMAQQVQGLDTYAGGPENIQKAYNDIVQKNGGKANICAQ